MPVVKKLKSAEGTTERLEELRKERAKRFFKFAQRRDLRYTEIARALFPDGSENLIERFSHSLGKWARGDGLLPTDVAVLLGRTYKKFAMYFYVAHQDRNEAVEVQTYHRRSTNDLREHVLKTRTRETTPTSPPESNGQAASPSPITVTERNGQPVAIQTPESDAGRPCLTGDNSSRQFTCEGATYELDASEGATRSFIATGVPVTEAQLHFNILRMTAGRPRLLKTLHDITIAIVQ